jgi:integrase
VKDKKARQKLAKAQEKVYSTEQIAALLDRLENGSDRLTDYRDLAIIALILGSGMRASEACNLNISQLRDIQDGVVCCKRKGGEMSEVNVASFVYPHVQRYLLLRGKCAPDAPLFVSQKGNRMTRNALWKSFASKQRELGLDTGVHRFRHTFLSDVDHHSNGSAALARDLGGHSSVAITNNYLHTTPEERRAAVNSMSYASMLAE